MTTGMKHNQEQHRERAHLFPRGGSCVSAVTFGSWSAAFTQEVYTRANRGVERLIMQIQKEAGALLHS